MNRTIAILLLSLQLYATGGYVALRQYMVNRSDAFFNAQAAKDQYCKADLFEVKIPVSFSNVQNWAHYERISGQIRFQNNVYNYVQLRITRQALYLKCIPNYQGTRYTNQNVLSATPIKDIPVPKKEHVPDAGVLLIAGLPLSLQANPLRAIVIDYPLSDIPAYRQPAADRAIETLKQPPRFSIA